MVYEQLWRTLKSNDLGYMSRSEHSEDMAILSSCHTPWARTELVAL